MSHYFYNNRPLMEMQVSHEDQQSEVVMATKLRSIHIVVQAVADHYVNRISENLSQCYTVCSRATLLDGPMPTLPSGQQELSPSSVTPNGGSIASVAIPASLNFLTEDGSSLQLGTWSKIDLGHHGQLSSSYNSSVSGDYHNSQTPSGRLWWALLWALWVEKPLRFIGLSFILGLIPVGFCLPVVGSFICRHLQLNQNMVTFARGKVFAHAHDINKRFLLYVNTTLEKQNLDQDQLRQYSQSLAQAHSATSANSPEQTVGWDFSYEDSVIASSVSILETPGYSFTLSGLENALLNAAISPSPSVHSETESHGAGVGGSSVYGTSIFRHGSYTPSEVSFPVGPFIPVDPHLNIDDQDSTSLGNDADQILSSSFPAYAPTSNLVMAEGTSSPLQVHPTSNMPLSANPICGTSNQNSRLKPVNRPLVRRNAIVCRPSRLKSKASLSLNNIMASNALAPVRVCQDDGAVNATAIEGYSFRVFPQVEVNYNTVYNESESANDPCISATITTLAPQQNSVPLSTSPNSSTLPSTVATVRSIQTSLLDSTPSEESFHDTIHSIDDNVPYHNSIASVFRRRAKDRSRATLSDEICKGFENFVISPHKHQSQQQGRQEYKMKRLDKRSHKESNQTRGPLCINNSDRHGHQSDAQSREWDQAKVATRKIALVKEDHAWRDTHLNKSEAKARYNYRRQEQDLNSQRRIESWERYREYQYRARHSQSIVSRTDREKNALNTLSQTCFEHPFPPFSYHNPPTHLAQTSAIDVGMNRVHNSMASISASIKTSAQPPHFNTSLQKQRLKQHRSAIQPAQPRQQHVRQLSPITRKDERAMTQSQQHVAAGDERTNPVPPVERSSNLLLCAPLDTSTLNFEIDPTENSRGNKYTTQMDLRQHNSYQARRQHHLPQYSHHHHRHHRYTQQSQRQRVPDAHSYLHQGTVDSSIHPLMEAPTAPVDVRALDYRAEEVDGTALEQLPSNLQAVQAFSTRLIAQEILNLKLWKTKFDQDVQGTSRDNLESSMTSSATPLQYQQPQQHYTHHLHHPHLHRHHRQQHYQQPVQGKRDVDVVKEQQARQHPLRNSNRRSQNYQSINSANPVLPVQQCRDSTTLHTHHLHAPSKTGLYDPLQPLNQPETHYPSHYPTVRSQSHPSHSNVKLGQHRVYSNLNPLAHSDTLLHSVHLNVALDSSHDQIVRYFDFQRVLLWQSQMNEQFYTGIQRQQEIYNQMLAWFDTQRLQMDQLKQFQRDRALEASEQLAHALAQEQSIQAPAVQGQVQGQAPAQIQTQGQTETSTVSEREYGSKSSHVGSDIPHKVNETTFGSKTEVNE
ncbi:hypothetical protein FBU30_009511 [Linnemannia zychae]|nr:hypothetical protein FBU30_009511 [Linnemannia zychae]